MFILNNKVKVVGDKIIAYQNYSTPGVYRVFNVNDNTDYKIILEGYEGLNNTKLWIADIYNRKIYYKSIDNYEILYHNKKHRRIKIGILFCNKFKIGDYFTLTDIKLLANNSSNNILNNILNNTLNNKLEVEEMYKNLYYTMKSNLINKSEGLKREETLSSNMLVNDKLIIQLCTSHNIKYFDTYAKRKYKLSPYFDKTKPVIFYGCYNDSDIRRIKNHIGHKVLIWGGSDIMNRRVRSLVFKIKNLKHVAQSSFIKNDLKKFNQKYTYLPFAPTVNYNLYSSIEKGAYIYIYTNACNQEFYGSRMYNRLLRQFPKLKFIITTNISSYYDAKRRGLNCRYLQTFNPNDMYKVYRKCFIGLRLTKHDGISATVQELGMMGIRTIHNGKTPNCINYRTYEDIVRIIMDEMVKIGERDDDISNNTREHLKICDELLLYLFKTITIESEIYVMINYNKWQSYNNYIRRKKSRWIMYNKNGEKIYKNDNLSSYVPPIDGWY